MCQPQNIARIAERKARHLVRVPMQASLMESSKTGAHPLSPLSSRNARFQGGGVRARKMPTLHVRIHLSGAIEQPVRRVRVCHALFVRSTGGMKLCTNVDHSHNAPAGTSNDSAFPVN